ncbi:MAG: pyridoxamine 5'-phosphate oxidase family protein [Candidatus Thorarchaeota archaeon]
MDEKLEFLANQKLLHLATMDKDGHPHVVPVWYQYVHGKLYIGSHTRTKKVKNILNDPRISFCVDVGIRAPIYGVMGVGDAHILLDNKRVVSIAEQILLRYFDTLKHPNAAEILADTNCVIEITLHSIVSWKY